MPERWLAFPSVDKRRPLLETPNSGKRASPGDAGDAGSMPPPTRVGIESHQANGGVASEYTSQDRTGPSDKVKTALYLLLNRTLSRGHHADIQNRPRCPRICAKP